MSASSPVSRPPPSSALCIVLDENASLSNPQAPPLALGLWEGETEPTPHSNSERRGILPGETGENFGLEFTFPIHGNREGWPLGGIPPGLRCTPHRSLPRCPASGDAGATW